MRVTPHARPMREAIGLHVTVLASDRLSARLTCRSCTVTISSSFSSSPSRPSYSSSPAYSSCLSRYRGRYYLVAPSPLPPPPSPLTAILLIDIVLVASMCPPLFLTLRATLAISQRAATYLATLPDVSTSLRAVLVMSRAASRRWMHAALDATMDATRNDPPSGRTSVKRTAVRRGRAVGAGLAIDFDRPPPLE